jgi:hypothetical protein
LKFYENPATTGSSSANHPINGRRKKKKEEETLPAALGIEVDLEREFHFGCYSSFMQSEGDTYLEYPRFFSSGARVIDNRRLS